MELGCRTVLLARLLAILAILGLLLLDPGRHAFGRLLGRLAGRAGALLGTNGRIIAWGSGRAGGSGWLGVGGAVGTLRRIRGGIEVEATSGRREGISSLNWHAAGLAVGREAHAVARHTEAAQART